MGGSYGTETWASLEVIEDDLIMVLEDDLGVLTREG